MGCSSAPLGSVKTTLAMGSASASSCSAPVTSSACRHSTTCSYNWRADDSSSVTAVKLAELAAAELAAAAAGAVHVKSIVGVWQPSSILAFFAAGAVDLLASLRMTPSAGQAYRTAFFQPSMNSVAFAGCVTCQPPLSRCSLVKTNPSPGNRRCPKRAGRQCRQVLRRHYRLMNWWIHCFHHLPRRHRQRVMTG